MTTTPSPPAASPALPEPGPTPTSTTATRSELLSALDELLEAERAGARVAMETGQQLTAPDLVPLVQDIHTDEVRWCGMLMRTIRSMEATPSSTTGAFHGKAMAIADVDDRLKFLNRGQAWVVRRLEALIPRVEDASVRAELNEMLQAHRHNIDRVDARYRAGQPADPAAPASRPR